MLKNYELEHIINALKQCDSEFGLYKRDSQAIVYYMNNNKGIAIGNGGNGGAVLNGGAGGSHGGGGGGSGYTNGTVTVISTEQGGGEGVARVVISAS